MKILNRFALLLEILGALVINFIIEAFSRHSVVAAWIYLTETPMVFLYNAFMIFVTFTFVHLFRRRVFARIVVSVLWLFIGVVNGVMLSNRVTPFNAQDLKTITEGLSLFPNYFTIIEMVFMAIGVLALIAGAVVLYRRTGKYTGKLNRVLAAAGVGAACIVYSMLTQWAIDQRVVSTYFGNIAFAYEDYGLPYCFCASVFNTGISEPNGYEEKAIGRISNDGKITEVTAETEVFPNVIFVQLESFFDTSEYLDLQTSEDPLPYFRSLLQEYSSGYFKVPSVGAGTANTEFEVLTGMNLRYFGPGEYPYKTILKENVAESAATAYASFGYGAHALHNNNGDFYSRATVFDNLGFDSYTSEEFMNILQFTENGWAKDDILLPHIENALNSTEQQDFVFAISVQGHGEYPEEKLIENPRITVSGLETEAENNAWEYYVNQIYEMDQFVKHLVEMMEERDEPTVIVFYGDHLPTMGLEATDMKSKYLYNTNYVIWDNIGLEKKDDNLPAYQIMSDVMGRIGMHSGTIFNYHQNRRQTQNYLKDLELLQYDILYGEQYVYGGNLPITEGHIEMGILDVILTELDAKRDGTYNLYGTNFTKCSKVYVNGDKQDGTFLNNTRIELPDSKIEEGDIITVSQVGNGNTIYRTSAEYIIYEGKLTEYTEALKIQLEMERAIENWNEIQ